MKNPPDSIGCSKGSSTDSSSRIRNLEANIRSLQTLISQRLEQREHSNVRQNGERMRPPLNFGISSTSSSTDTRARHPLLSGHTYITPPVQRGRIPRAHSWPPRQTEESVSRIRALPRAHTERARILDILTRALNLVNNIDIVDDNVDVSHENCPWEREQD